MVDYMSQDKTHFRIFPASDYRPPNWYMYHFIESIFGYQAAKLQLYQTFLEKSDIARLNPAALQLLNVKYLISNRELPYQVVAPGVTMGPNYPQTNLYLYPGFLPRAYFVDSVRVMTDDEFYEDLRSGGIDPARTAVLARPVEFELQADSTRQAEITSYDNHEIKLAVSVSKPSLLILSEIYYPAGWKVFIDGAEKQIHRTNAILRSVLVPPGQHEIRFVFRPKSFYIGLSISIIVFLGLLSLIIFDSRSKRRSKIASRGLAVG
jgi:hypothetical protein